MICKEKKKTKHVSEDDKCTTANNLIFVFYKLKLIYYYFYIY